MIDLILIVCSILAVFALIIWILSMITVPLVKAGVSIIFIILIGGVALVVCFAFWAMGISAFALLGLILIGIIIKVLSF